MLFHSVINSNNRLATDIVLQQEKSNLPDTFYQRVSEIGRLLDINTRSDTIKGDKIRMEGNVQGKDPKISNGQATCNKIEAS